MRSRRLPAAVLAAAGDRRGGAMEVAATALDGLLELAADPPLLEEAVAVLLAGQPAMAPMWHLAMAARDPDPAAALGRLGRSLHADADAAVAGAAAWLRERLAATPGMVATVSHSSLVDRALRSLTHGGPLSSRGSTAPRWGNLTDAGRGGGASSTAPVVGVVGADAIGPAALLNAVGTRELTDRVPALVVATGVKLVPAVVFDRLGGPGFEVVPLDAVAALVVGPEVLSPAEAGRRAAELAEGGAPRPPVPW